MIYHVLHNKIFRLKLRKDSYFLNALLCQHNTDTYIPQLSENILLTLKLQIINL